MKRFFTFIAVIFFSANLFAQVTVTFNVDLTDSITSGWFVVGTDDAYMAGNIFTPAWSTPGSDAQTQLFDNDGDGVYSIVLNDVAEGNYEYKSFKATAASPSWDNGEWNGGNNRLLAVGTSNVTINDVFGDETAHVVGIKNIKNISINIHPNPSTGIFQLSKKANYEVIDLTGKLVLSGNSNTINLTGFTSGMYIVKLSSNEGTSLQKLIVK